jgi:osmotically inducible protein OsmC
MATTRTARAHWEGSLTDGKGTTALESSGLGTFDLTWAARAESPQGLTSPEELLGAAHAGCYSMALSHALAQAGTPPESVDVTADVTFQPGTGITGIHLTVRGQVPGITAEQFLQYATETGKACPVSKALAATPITVDAALA